MAAKHPKRLKAPLSSKEMTGVELNCRLSSETKSEFAVSSLYLMLALQRAGITNGSQPFTIDDDLYTPPVFEPSYQGSVTTEVPRTLYAKSLPFAAELAPTPEPDQLVGLYIAKAIGLRNDIIDFAPNPSFLASNNGSNLLIVDLTPASL